MKMPLKLSALVWAVAVFSCTWGNIADDEYRTLKVDPSRLLSAIERGDKVLREMDKTNNRYGDLKDLVEADKEILRNPDLYDTTKTTVSDAQNTVDTAAVALHALIEQISPTPKPPEVTE